ncbi:MAG: SemiSWEET transporter [Euryarchaeota archaeon]|nr:SemiSWEET transporter [Euryarchaeota archaeon]
MDTLTLLGLTAGFITTLGFIPQLLKGYRTGSMEGVSLTMPLVLMLGMGMWLTYGVLTEDPPIIIWNAVSIVLNAGIVLLKVRSNGR